MLFSFCLSSSFYDRLAWRAEDISILDGDTSGTGSDLNQHPCMPLARLLSVGTFYFSDSKFDLSRPAQYRFTHSAPEPDSQFLWNHHMVHELHRALATASEIEHEDISFLVMMPTYLQVPLWDFSSMFIVV
jgi:hypothetical protein